ncbi:MULTISPECIES: disulfide bond formation protein DsbA [unclassified Mycobacterium]|uniref:mycothiol-dependent nitroreductase Rv2466c family protein n=1 Tax=unclassified Mycobacterium TaxID=2642494 RepID=UPI0008004AAF|nr:MULTISPECIES: disulfide bond formation protein DsbA [unclassified Mycobacterium]OBG61684.1 disulfide bond formation protein DsbA [Mycobacterium sp. E188]OBG66342.1 disulfide bond formation protein DsbA [Mycobacterium sp. E735]OBH21319.1 disulfide bond formation protein DsbA [Mycobacterium sp. E1715]OBH36396.1 disulfide bond formation protein DsbA [Mycobacterium sp. E183]
MTDVDLYLDPVCPFSWVTARWLIDAGQATGTPVTLRQMSLAVLNEGRDGDDKQQHMMERSTRAGRLFAAAVGERGPEAFAGLYDSIGRRIHVDGEELTAPAIREALAENGLAESLADAQDDSGLDEAVKRAHRVSQDTLGDEAGSPIIAVDGHAFSGPVLTRTLKGPGGVRLLEAVLTMAAVPEFAALQRPYEGPPTIEA